MKKKGPGIFIIAEAGVNHNGSLSIAKKMVDIAVAAGADAIKFQTFTAQALVCVSAPKAEYQKKTTDKSESQFEMLQKLELSSDAHESLKRYCQRKNIQFLSSAFDVDSVSYLAQLGLNIFKIPSGEITNYPYLRAIGVLKKKVILSTGMSTMKEISDALRILEQAGTLRRDITVLHCHTQYPTSPEDVNLSAMASIHKKFNVAVGYSDHTVGIAVPIAAAALGARVIEKHFTLNKEMSGPDHAASLDPDELQTMVRSIRMVEKALGDGIKRPTSCEKANSVVIRKSLVAAKPIKAGEVFTPCNVAVKRPGTGISPQKWPRVIGKRASRDYLKDQLIRL
jgi:N,N'-diacetyllegionaminate synthase